MNADWTGDRKTPNWVKDEKFTAADKYIVEYNKVLLEWRKDNLYNQLRRNDKFGVMTDLILSFVKLD